jgi:hypothetical protein
VNTEIKAQEAKDIARVFNRMFKDIESVKLRKYMIASVSFIQSLTVETITDMVIQICRTNDDDEEVLNYMFDVFSKH